MIVIDYTEKAFVREIYHDCDRWFLMPSLYVVSFDNQRLLHLKQLQRSKIPEGYEINETWNYISQNEFILFNLLFLW